MEVAHKLKPTFKLPLRSAFLILSLSSFSLPTYVTSPFSSRFQVTLPHLTELCHSEFFVDAKEINEKEENNLPKQLAGSESSYCWPAGKSQAKIDLGSSYTHF